MPDISDVGPPAKGPGLPERIAEAKPPPVKVRIEHGWVRPCYVCIYKMLNMLFNNLYHRRDCKEQEALKAAILKEIPEAQVEFLVGEGGELHN